MILESSPYEASQCIGDIGAYFLEQKQYDKAIKCFKSALTLDETDLSSLSNLAAGFLYLNQLKDSVPVLEKALSINPNYLPALRNQSYALLHLSKDREAIDVVHKLIQLDPNNPGNFFQLSGLHYNLLEFEKAIEIIKLNIENHPTHLDSRWFLGTLLLTLGNLKEGFEHYKYRIDSDALLIRKLDNPSPLWNGEEIEGKTLLVRGEQGLGDIIQFIRYVPYLSRYRCKLFVEIPPCLHVHFGHLGVPLTSNKSSQPQHDLHVHMLTFPSIFGTELSTIPPPISIGNAKLRPIKNRIGIVWKGNREHQRDWRRSLQLSQLAPLFQIDGLEYLSLQVDVTQEESKFLTAHGIRELKTTALTDTIRILETCERIICADTMIAHLAGSMGVPTWILLPYCPDWRWMMDRSDSPWYPSIRLFRQQHLDCWEDPLKKVVQCLSECS